MAWLKITLIITSCISFNIYGKDILKTRKAKLGNKLISIEIAETEKEKAQGLMGRKLLEKNSGMLFIYKDERILSFWMKNTLIALDIGFFDKKMKLIDIQTMYPEGKKLLDQYTIYSSKSAAMYALEMNKSWFTKNDIKIGTELKYVKSP